jgi:catechol 1,2-dioxygenase
MTDSRYFDAASSAEVVIARNAEAQDARLRAVMAVLTRHLHAAVREIEPTQDEWLQAIRFLTAVGHACDDWRQEYILLSDILGVSMLVDALNSRRPAGATENTVLGPFHRADAPERPLGANIGLDGKGTPMLVRGTVRDAVSGAPLAGAKVDVWQANDDGFYDVQQKGVQPDCNLRGVFRTDAEGSYWFRGAKPKHYAIPDDGPVGALLAALGRGPWRPAHLHVIVEAEGYDRLVTHVFDGADPHLDSDAVFGVKRSLIGTFAPVDDPARAQAVGLPNPFVELVFDVALAPR